MFSFFHTFTQLFQHHLGKDFPFYLFIYLWLHWVFVAACGLSLVAVSGGYSSLQCVGFSLWWLLLLGAWALGTWASVVVAFGLQ